MKRLLTLSVAALALGATPLAAQDIAITGATVASGDGSAAVENATVVVRGGRVVAAGTGVAVPGGVPVVDGEGMWVTPGLFASITNLGLVDVGAVSESNDVDADDGIHFAIGRSDAELVTLMLDLLGDETGAHAIGAAARDFVVTRQGWNAMLEPLQDLMQPDKACRDAA